MSAPQTSPKAQSSPISSSRDFLAIKPTRQELDMLLEARRDGIIRGVTLLSKFTCDVEGIAWSGVKSAVATGVGAATWGYKDQDPAAKAFDRAGAGTGDVTYGTVASFLEWVWERVMDKIVSNEWIQRLVRVFGIGLSVLLDWVKKTLLDADLIKGLIPLYGPIKGLIDTGVRAYDAMSASNALNRIAQAADQIGSGIPTQMFRHFEAYLSREIVINSGRAAYTFGKSLTSVLVSVFAAPAASALQLVSSIVEAVSGFVYMLFQGLTFKAATDKCREWVKVGDITQDLQLNESIAGCPFIGVLFFGAANYIGHFNLTAMLTKPQLLTSTNLQLAVSQVSGVQKVACQYFKSTEIPYRLVDSNYEWVLKMMRGMASSAPRSEFLTEDASAKAKFRHYGKKGLRTVMTGMKKVYSWMG